MDTWRSWKCYQHFVDVNVFWHFLFYSKFFYWYQNLGIWHKNSSVSMVIQSFSWACHPHIHITIEMTMLSNYCKYGQTKSAFRIHHGWNFLRKMDKSGTAGSPTLCHWWSWQCSSGPISCPFAILHPWWKHSTRLTLWPVILII